jgi:hypothetical protein
LHLTFDKEGQIKRVTMMTTQNATFKKTGFMALLTAVTLAMPMAAVAQEGQRPPKPPVAEMASALGVSQKAVKACFPAMDQKMEKGKKQARPERPDAAKIAKCLKVENKSLTTAKVDKVLKDFAPPQQRG